MIAHRWRWFTIIVASCVLFSGVWVWRHSTLIEPAPAEVGPGQVEVVAHTSWQLESLTVADEYTDETVPFWTPSKALPGAKLVIARIRYTASDQFSCSVWVQGDQRRWTTFGISSENSSCYGDSDGTMLIAAQVPASAVDEVRGVLLMVHKPSREILLLGSVE